MTRRSRSTIPLVLLGITAFAIPLACGGGDKPANDPSKVTTSSSSVPSGNASTASSTTLPSSSASAAASANPLATVLTTDPAQVAALLAAAASAAAPLLQAPGATAGDPVEAGIRATAAKTAPGMQPDGQLATGDLKQGDHLAMQVTLQPGKCYAVVGYSAGVKDLDLRLLAPPFYNVLAGEDTTDDNTPVIGKAPNPMCPILPIGLPYKVDIMSEKGAGKVGVMLFSKPK